MAGLGSAYSTLNRWLLRLSRKSQSRHPHDRSSPNSDPTLAGSGKYLDTAHTGVTVAYGTVVEAVPFLGWYRVLTESGRPPMGCCALSQGGFTPGAVRRGASPYPVGTPVWFVKHPRAQWGCIIGSEPVWQAGPNQSFAEFISQCSNGGFQVDAAHNYLLRLKNHGIIDFSAGGLLDETAAGENAALSDMGPGTFADAFMAFMRADENCGVWAFRFDRLLRLHGHNLEVRSAMTEASYVDDEGELDLTDHLSVYKYEADGYFDPAENPTNRTFTAEELLDETYYGYAEPAFDDMEPVRRILKYGGYLGQGGRKTICLPPAGITGPNRLSNPQDFIGVADDATGLDGLRVIRSATGVLIAKTPSFSVAVRQKADADKAGDNINNYRPAGGTGAGPEHQVVSAPTIPSGATPAEYARDLEAYAFAWKADHPFHYHENDYHLPEPLQTEVVPDYASLEASYALASPQTENITVDARYAALVALVTSALHLHADGSVTLRAGSGAAITLGADGNVEISAPGDIAVRSGRTAQIWGGRDVILKAFGSVEATATTDAVRIKGGTHVELLADTGAVLIESKASELQTDFIDNTGDGITAGGVLIKAGQSGIVTLAPEVYVGASDQFTVDAGSTGAIVLQADTVSRFLATGSTDSYGSEGEITAVATYGPSGVSLPGELDIGGALKVGSGGEFGGAVQIVNGHIYTDQGDPKVGDLGGGSESVHSDLDDVTKGQQAATTQSTSSYQTLLASQYYQSGQPGDPATAESIGFSFRSSEECGTEDFILAEAAWQQMARLADQSLSTWTEVGVSAGNELTYPWPGRQTWKDGQALRQVDLTLFDVAAEGSGPAPLADGAYETPTLAQPRLTTADGTYTIVG